VDAELVVDVLEVLLHGPRADQEAAGDLRVRLAVRYENEDLVFSRRQRGEDRGRFGPERPLSGFGALAECGSLGDIPVGLHQVRPHQVEY
jgi:hypothetical protein